jgi:hypothetical protein
VRQPLTSVHAQVCRHLAEQTADLEAAAHPALDALTRRVMTTTLERVRRVKTRLVRLKTRVETVRLLFDAAFNSACSRCELDGLRMYSPHARMLLMPTI